MESLIVMLGNWRSTLVGALMAVVIYEAGVGNKLPETKHEWWALGLAVLAQILGLTTKDAKTGSRPGASPRRPQGGW